MDCTGVALHLVAYQLGTVTDEERDVVEAHLLECAACLKTYLALKRAADRAELDRPSPAARARLRESVQREFAPRKPFFARRIPVYQSVAFAAIAAAIALALPSVLSRTTTRPEARAGEPSVDTARTRAESLHIY